MLKTLFTLLFAAAVFVAGVFVGNFEATRPFSKADDILSAVREKENIRAAATVRELNRSLRPFSNELKPLYAMMVLCKKDKTLQEIRLTAIEMALHKITHELQKEINNGTLATREAVVFAFSGAFSSWLFNIREPNIIRSVQSEVRRNYGKLTKSVCDKEEKEALGLIRQMKFALSAD